MSRRRLCGALACSLVVISLDVGAQHRAPVRRIGWLWNTAPRTADEFREHTTHLRTYGWTEGQNLAIEQRYANHNPALLVASAVELVRLKVELIVAE